MKSIYLSIKFFKKHFFANLLIVLEIVFALFVATLLMNRTYYLFRNVSFFSDTAIEKSVYFMGHAGEWTDNNTYLIEGYHDKLREDLAPYSEVIDGFSTVAEFTTTEEHTVFVYDAITADYLKENFNGEPFPEEENGVLPAFVYNDMTVGVGDEVTLEIYVQNQFVTNIEDSFEPDLVPVELTISSIVKEISPTLIHSGTMKTNTLFDMQNLTLEGANVYTDRTVYFIPYTDELFGDYQFQSDTFFIYFSEDILPEQVDDIRAILNTYGTHFLGSDILEETRARAESQFAYDLYMFVSIAVIAIVSLLSITFLNVKKMMRYISVYYINGCSFRKAMQIYFTYLLGLLLLSVVLFLSYMGYMQISIASSMERSEFLVSAIYSATYAFNLINQLIAFAIVFFILFAGSFLPFRFISRKSLIQIIKEER